MNKFLLLTFVILCVLSTAKPYSLNAQDDRFLNAVLAPAEDFFVALKNKKFDIAWSLLSKKSRETIINDVYKASTKIGGTTTKEDIERDFSGFGIISRNYWNSFLTTFDPNMILEKSRWEIGFIKELEAEIIITYKRSEEPAKLKIFNEDNAWKVGLVETFWTRKP